MLRIKSACKYHTRSLHQIQLRLIQQRLRQVQLMHGGFHQGLTGVISGPEMCIWQPITVTEQQVQGRVGSLKVTHVHP